MKFSLFFEFQLPNPTPARERALYQACVEQAVLADELGYHCIWAVEHHGLYEYSHMSAPEVFLAHVAARTRRIRLGHGVTLMPHRYNHPIRIAERVATLDILSEGRVNWGSGKSATLVEQGAFGVERSQMHDEWRETIEMVPRMWTEDVFEHHGRYFDIPPTRIVPKPVQDPHPPMFAACLKPEFARALGELGMGALNLATYTDEVLKQRVAEYKEACRQAKPVGFRATNHFACNPSVLVLEDDKKACRYGLRGAQFFVKGLAYYFVTGERPMGPVPMPAQGPDDAFVAKFQQQRNAPGSTLSTIIGSPSAARETVQRFVDVGLDEIILVMQLGTIPNELVLESIRLFGEKVLPHFAD